MFLLLLLMFGQEIDQDFNDLIWLMIILTNLSLFDNVVDVDVYFLFGNEGWGTIQHSIQNYVTLTYI